MKTAVVIVAGGSGTRMGAAMPKQFMTLAGKPVIVHTIERFRRALPDASICLVLGEQSLPLWKEIAKEYDPRGLCIVCKGGETRFGSVKNALESIPECDVVLVHDAVRPLVPVELIRTVERLAALSGAVVPVTVPADSFRAVQPDGSSAPIDRDKLRAVQTPQGFGGELLRKAYRQSYLPSFTDDASVVERYGHPVTLCEGSPYNIKITWPEDVALAEALLRAGGKQKNDM